PSPSPLPRSETSEYGLPQRELSVYEQACISRKLLPKFVSRIQDAVSGDVFDLRGAGLGDDQLLAVFADSNLCPAAQIRRWRLHDVRMRDRGVKRLSELLDEEVEAIDLANNELGHVGMGHLARALCHRSLEQLRRLDLSANALSDEAACRLAKGLQHCPRLLRLDLRNNAIQDGHALGELIAGHGNVTRLSLRRNRLAGFGMAALFNGILENAHRGGQLADVDVAWNPLAQDGPLAAKAIATVFRESATLYHCDLSYCCLDSASCALLGEGLRDNHSLYGLHVVGNAATMDADGFLTPLQKDPIPPDADHKRSVVFGSVQPGPEALLGAQGFGAEDDLNGRDVLEMKSACWACEGWIRQEIEWPYDPGDPPRAVWAFTALDSFRRALRLRPEAGHRPCFKAARMVPPGHRLQVIFQVDSRIQLLPGARDKLAVPAELTLRICQELPELAPDPDQVICSESSPRSGRPVYIASMSEASVVERRMAHDDVTSTSACRACRGVVTDGPADGDAVLLPRVTEAEFKAKAKRSPPFWSTFKKESLSLRREALRTDWLRCRLGHVVPDAELEDIKKAMEPHYGWLMCLYHRVSSLDASGEIGFGISQLQAGELMSGCGICDGTTTKVADIDRFFIAAKVTPAEMKKTMAIVNDKTLVRYEFLEFLLRVANHHFFKSGAATSMAEAIALLLQTLEAEGRKMEREVTDFLEALWVEAVDDLYKKHVDMLGAVYKRFYGSKTPPGKPKFMALGEFQSLMEVADVHATGFQVRQSALAFRMGMMSQPDETGSSRFQEMSFLEFQMALGAVAFLMDEGKAAQLLLQLKRLFGLLSAVLKGKDKAKR
ncbi:LRRC74A, partial [Symbiodinium sp. KB8]